MHLCSTQICGLLFILNLQLSVTYPISSGLADSSVDILKELLQRLEQSVSDQIAVDQVAAAEKDDLDREDVEPQIPRWSSAAAAVDRRRPETDEAAIREFLSPKDLKSVRNDSSRRSSGCFGRRMDRIGSMSSLGCNTVGRSYPKQR